MSYESRVMTSQEPVNEFRVTSHESRVNESRVMMSQEPVNESRVTSHK